MLIGLTGGIGSGKSVVATFFAELNVPVIKADAIINTLTQPGTPAYQAIVKKLGKDILSNTASLNKIKLRQIIFINAQTRLWLEELLHPELYNIMAAQINPIKAPYCVLEIPLLIEKPPPLTIDRILVVDCLPEQQIERTVARDNISIAEAKKIISIQIDRHSRLAKCHDIIVNDGYLAELKQAVANLHSKYLGLCTKLLH